MFGPGPIPGGGIYQNRLASLRGPHHQGALAAHLASFDPVPIHFIRRAESRKAKSLRERVPRRIEQP